MVSEEIHHLEEVRRIATAVGQRKRRMDQVEKYKRQSCLMGGPQAHGSQNIKFPYKGNLRRFTNTSQPSCLGVNYIQPMQSMWENYQQIYSHWMRVCSKKLNVEI